MQQPEKASASAAGEAWHALPSPTLQNGHTGNFPGYTQLMAADADGRRSLTFSITSQVNGIDDPAPLKRLRAVQENFVCALLREK